MHSREPAIARRDHLKLVQSETPFMSLMVLLEFCYSLRSPLFRWYPIQQLLNWAQQIHERIKMILQKKNSKSSRF